MSNQYWSLSVQKVMTSVGARLVGISAFEMTLFPPYEGFLLWEHIGLI
jgi:hypothetical protein